MDPYTFNCSNADSVQPHVLTQCACWYSIQVLSEDIVSLYTKLRELINREVYTNQWLNDTIGSCTFQNQAMLWLSSGNVRDGGDLYQRYVLAVLYLKTSGTGWYNSSNWLSNYNECRFIHISLKFVRSNQAHTYMNV
jgi:hypothetical protein